MTYVKQNYVLVISNTAWSIWNFRQRLMKHLTNAGYLVEWAAAKDDYVDRIPLKGYPVRFPYRRIDIPGIMVSFISLCKLIFTRRPKYILTYTALPNMLVPFIGKLSGAEVICNVAGLGTLLKGKDLLSGILRSVYGLSLSMASYIFFQNSDDASLFPKVRSKSHVLPGSGVDIIRIKPVKNENRFTGKSGSLNILFSGRLLEEKGIGVLVAALDKLKMKKLSYRLDIIGDYMAGVPGYIEPELFNKIGRDDKIRYHGKVDNPIEFIHQADILVFPSYYNEGTPRSVLEALACGKPVITTDWPGCRDTVIDGYNGFLCKVRDESSLANAISEFVALSPSNKKKFSANSRKLAEVRFDENIVLDAYLQAIKGIDL